MVGDFAGLTNIGGRGGPGGISRGKLVLDFILDPSLDLPDNIRQYMGFNLMWGNVFADQVEIKCVSNCAVEVDDAGWPKIDTLCQGVYGLANDLFGDEFVKCPYIRRRIAHILDSTPASEEPSQDETRKLRDRLAALFTEQQPLLPAATQAAGGPASMSLWSFFAKFFHTSVKRRVQPGLRTFLSASAALTVFFLVAFLVYALTISSPSVSSSSLLASFFGCVVLGALVPSLLAGLYHHLRMQHLFVKLRLPWRRRPVYGTISQTVILVRRDRTVHYFFRDTRGHTIKPWEETTFSF
ncbi:uncharacterized protein ACA1_290530 [Acanthamoeba castellanii str. Neff]|uniref:Uncharacterized protein n=1 Tax=Acanthamoeba castellanii (strain ATCC 30010 / Neff) TaxID=1257118 RepID=L8HKS7_ACACF|nr:uncharacterized protein ACA1_290530 [Acanthamoeba castellanii str. Neff]ELR25278.1 hypothetical protein ACA1_290530 [Acanthamoeba castellanii str. Neff]